MTEEATVVTLVRRFYDRLWNAWDDTAVDGTLAPDFVFRGSLGDQTHGPDGWRAYREKIRTGCSDFHNDVVDLLADGDRAAVRLLYSGTHDGPLLGWPATNRRFTYSGAAFFTARHGRLTSAWVLGDLNALGRQLASRG